ncbi:ribosomal L32p protein family-domain-containing protein [Abortiporus biennis]|nr:ribosomal L32p protein family-domain-containing protein [Abortiporus biennis]
MASLVLPQSRSLFQAFRLPWARPTFAAALLPSLSKPLAWALPSLQSLLELFPPFVLAVPKKKTSHSRKAMRSANKGLKDKENLVHCPGCGAPKLAHHLCSNCYSTLNRGFKAKTRQGGIPSVEMD